MDKRSALLVAYKNLMNVQGVCSLAVFNDLGLSQLTMKQIEYLKTIHKYDDLTFSQLAEIFNLSKPTVSEMIIKFIKMDCVYKEQSQNDGRVYFIRLTEKGEYMAKVEQHKADMAVDRIFNSLTDQEIDALIELLEKIR